MRSLQHAVMVIAVLGMLSLFVVACTPIDPIQAYMRSGAALVEQGDSAGALEAFDALLARNSEYAPAYLARGQSLLETGQLAAALQDFDKAIELNPGSAAAYVGRGIVNRMHAQDADRAGEAEKAAQFLATAQQDLERALALDASSPSAYKESGNVAQLQGDFERASEEFTRVIELAPEDSAGYFLRGVAAAAAGQPELAVSDLQRAVALDPTPVARAESLIALGKVYYSSGNGAASLAAFQEAWELQPDNEYACAMSGIVAMRNGKTTTAERVMQACNAMASSDLARTQSAQILDLLRADQFRLGPIDLAMDDQSLWVANREGASVTQVSLADGAVVGVIPLEESVVTVLVRNGMLWMTAPDSGSVLKFDIAQNRFVGRYSVGNAPWSLAADAENLWVGNQGDGTVTKLRQSDGQVLGTYPAGPTPRALALAGDRLWVLGEGDTVMGLDLVSGAQVAEYRIVPSNFINAFGMALAAQPEALWVASSFGITRVDLNDGSLAGPYFSDISAASLSLRDTAWYTASGGPSIMADLVLVDDAVWAVNATRRTIGSVSAEDGATRSVYPIKDTLEPLFPTAIVADGDTAWIANYPGDEIVHLSLADGKVLGSVPLRDKREPAPSVSRLPNMAVPPALTHAISGTEQFDENSQVIYTAGDWAQIYSLSQETYVPVPLGWRTVETFSEAYLLFDADGPAAPPTIRVRLGFDLPKQRTMAEEVAAFEDQIKAAKGAVLTKAILDEDKAYVFAEAPTESGRQRFLLEAFGRCHADCEENGAAGQAFYTFSAFTYQEDWERFYPLVRAMFERWQSKSGVQLGFLLPETLPAP